MRLQNTQNATPAVSRALTSGQRTEEEGERAARREEGEFLDTPTTLLRDGGGAHLRISSREGANVAGCGGAGAVCPAAVFWAAVAPTAAMVESVGGWRCWERVGEAERS